jgi:hypothetical protein
MKFRNTHISLAVLALAAAYALAPLAATTAQAQTSVVLRSVWNLSAH